MGKKEKGKKGKPQKSHPYEKEIPKIVLCLILRKEEYICLFGVRGINQILAQQNSDPSQKQQGINSNIPHVQGPAPTYAEMT